MPNSATAELYFIAAMFLLILLISAVSVYFFLRTYKNEKKAKQKRLEQKLAEKNKQATIEK